jgi:hypothetical protein
MFQFQPRRHNGFITSLVCAFALAACGGGGGSVESASNAGPTTTGSAPTGSTATAATVNAVTTGPISGFGSIIINGVHYDDSAAKVILDDDNNARSADLRLGMMAQVESQKDANAGTARATSIATRSYVQGPISALSPGINQLTVLGITVTATPTTVFDNVANLSGLALNDKVEIHGLPDASGNLTATRIEKLNTAEARLIGTVQNASTTGRFTLGSITVLYQPTALIDFSNVTNGSLVRVKGNLTAANTITASAIRAINLTAPSANGQLAEMEGIITAFTNSSRFSVNNVAVTVGAGATVQGSPALGSRVEVVGTVTGTALTATKVEVKNQAQVEVEANELHDAIASLDLNLRTFTLRNGTVTIKWDNSTVFETSLPNGAGSLRNNLRVEVKGRVNGSVLLASRIKLDN